MKNSLKPTMASFFLGVRTFYKTLNPFYSLYSEECTPSSMRAPFFIYFSLLSSWHMGESEKCENGMPLNASFLSLNNFNVHCSDK